MTGQSEQDVSGLVVGGESRFGFRGIGGARGPLDHMRRLVWFSDAAVLTILVILLLAPGWLTTHCSTLLTANPGPFLRLPIWPHNQHVTTPTAVF